VTRRWPERYFALTPPPQDWRSGVVVVTVLGGTLTAAFEAGRVHNSVEELKPKVEKVQTAVDALRADMNTLRVDVRADMDALRADGRADMGKLNDKLDILLKYSAYEKETIRNLKLRFLMKDCSN
jgi:hypothetical protein